MDNLFNRTEINKKRRHFIVITICLGLIYVAYWYLTNDLFPQYKLISESSLIRLLIRECFVYVFALVGFVFFKYERLNLINEFQFLRLIVFLDLFCFVVGFARLFFYDFEILRVIYVNLIGLLASPILFVCLGIYNLYNSNFDENESE